MPVNLSRSELMRIVEGQAIPSENKLTFTGVQYDSRAVTGGELFVATKGERVDGHDYVLEAFNKGASLFLVENEELAKTFPEPDRLVQVKDTIYAFGELARWWRDRIGVPIIGITGSVGKTTVKEITASLLLRQNLGAYAFKSHNSLVGLPYTICRMSFDHEWAVLEMGMSKAGELKRLSEVSGPDVAMITCIAPAHTESFDSIDEIADAKLEIVSGLKEGGTLILNADDPVLMAAAERHNISSRFKIKTFGTTPGCDAELFEIMKCDLEGVAFKFKLLDSQLEAEMRLLGKHNALNAVAAALGASVLMPEISAKDIAEGLREFRAPLMRLNLKKTSTGRDLIDDSYNANPASILAALEFLENLKASGKKVGLMLGDMRELGKDSELYHREIGEAVVKFNPEFVVSVGEEARVISEVASTSSVVAEHAESPEEAAAYAASKQFDILLVKGSRGIELDRAVSKLVED